MGFSRDEKDLWVNLRGRRRDCWDDVIGGVLELFLKVTKLISTSYVNYTKKSHVPCSGCVGMVGKNCLDVMRINGTDAETPNPGRSSRLGSERLCY